MQLLTQTPALNVHYDEQHHWLYAQWHGALSEVRVKEGCAQLLRCQADAGTTRLLNDNVQVSQPWPEGIAWGARVWLPAMAEAGLRYVAWVYSAHLLSRLVFDQSQSDIVFPVTASFSNVADAVEWLRSQRPGVGRTPSGRLS